MKHKRGFLKTFMWTTSAAAVVLAMVVVTFFFAGAGGNALAGTTPREVAHAAISMMESPFFTLDLQNDRQAALYEYLKDKNLPTPAQLPSGLKDVKGVGCKYLEIGERKSRASLICYKKNGKVVHLVMMEKKALTNPGMTELKKAMGECRGCDENDEWALASWADAEHAYFLLGIMEPEELAACFK